MMSDMIQKPTPYRYVGKNDNGELLFKVNSKSSNMEYTIVVSVIHDDSLSSVPTYEIRHDDENECEGYKHRANCWHINDIQLDECHLCLTPLIGSVVVVHNGKYFHQHPDYCNKMFKELGGTFI